MWPGQLDARTGVGAARVRVNAVAPGYFESEMMSTKLSDDRSLRWVARREPMGRPGRQGELDGALMYLASDASSDATSQVLVVGIGWKAV
jgi:NAD(P)-dependent dehydrogenase (short-subunit alcohol dehydrogenase family)